MSDIDAFEEKIVTNSENTAGLVIPGDGYLDDFDAAMLDVEYLRDMVALAEEMDWERLWLRVSDQDHPVFIESEDNHGVGSLMIAPILESDGEDGGGDDD